MIENEENWNVYRNTGGELFAVQRKNKSKAFELNADMLTAVCIKENVSLEEMNEIIENQ